MEGRVRVAIVMLVLVTFCPTEGISSNLHPVVLVPGIVASTIVAQVREDAPPPINESCFWTSHTPFWLLAQCVFLKQCFLDSMKLYYNTELDDYRNTPGLETTVPAFGSPTNNPLLGCTMAKLLESLRKIGYKDDVNLFGAPYDYRYGLAAEGHHSSVGSQFLQNLTKLIENASALNSGKPVILLSHSLGGLFSLQLLNRNSLFWRQKYIKHFIPIATPWGGAVIAMAAFGSGVDINVTNYCQINHTEMRDITRGMESTVWLMPTPGAFGCNTTLVVTPTANYTACDVSQFIQNATELPDAALPYETRILPLVENLTAPEVNVTLIIGTNCPTAETLRYNDTGFDQPPVFDYGDGDGIVNLVSALWFETEWARNENQTAPKIIKLPGISHGNLVKEDVAVDALRKEICLINGNCTESPALSAWTGKANS